MTSKQFTVGQRIQLSELGRFRSSRSLATTGVVVSANHRTSRGAVSVLMDGNKKPKQIHYSYLEPETEK